MRDRAGQSLGGNLQSDTRRKVTGRLNANYSWGEGEGIDRRVLGNVQVRPVENWTLSRRPSAAATSSRASSRPRCRWTRDSMWRSVRSSRSSSSCSRSSRVGTTGVLRELCAPGVWAFNEHGTDVGTISYDDASDRYAIDPDGSGPAAIFTVLNQDFNSQSLRGNAVLRWEYRPGSTMYLVWQQRRSDIQPNGDSELGRDARSIFDARPDDGDRGHARTPGPAHRVCALEPHRASLESVADPRLACGCHDSSRIPRHARSPDVGQR